MPWTSPELKSPNTFTLDPVNHPLDNWQTGPNGLDAYQRTPLPIGGEPEHEASFGAVADQIGPEERPKNIEATYAARITSEQLLVHNVEPGIAVHIEEAVSNVVGGTLAVKRIGVNNRLLVALETLVVCTAYNVVNSQKFISRFLDAVIYSPAFVAPVAALVGTEQ